MRKTPWIFRTVITACVGLLCSATRANTVTYDVTLDTSSLESLPLVYLDFQLIGTAGNSVTISAFNYGVGGEAVGPAYIYEGNASGDISTSVSLSESPLPFSDNELYERFIPGDTLSFQVITSASLSASPDGFYFNILYGPNDPPNSIYPINIPTTDPTLGTNDLLSLTYGPDDLMPETWSGLDDFSSLPAPSIQIASAVPLPQAGAMGLALLPLAGLMIWRRSRNLAGE
jgi:hypothetical protein